MKLKLYRLQCRENISQRLLKRELENTKNVHMHFFRLNAAHAYRFLFLSIVLTLGTIETKKGTLQ